MVGPSFDTEVSGPFSTMSSAGDCSPTAAGTSITSVGPGPADASVCCVPFFSATCFLMSRIFSLIAFQSGSFTFVFFAGLTSCNPIASLPQVCFRCWPLQALQSFCDVIGTTTGVVDLDIISPFTPVAGATPFLPAIGMARRPGIFTLLLAKHSETT